MATSRRNSGQEGRDDATVRLARATFARSRCCRPDLAWSRSTSRRRKDGYEAAQIGLVEFVKESRLTKPMRGHLAKNNLPPVKFMREVPLEVDGRRAADGEARESWRSRPGRYLRRREVCGYGRSQQGPRFQGVVKRHHFAGGPKSHGSMFQITGSIGSSAFPSRVFKGMRMSGHMGDAG